MTMIQKVLSVLVLAILVSGLMWGATDGKKQTSTLLPANPDTSAPDAWGYTWVKSNEAGGPTFRWVDIATRGTRVNGLTDDNVVGPFDMLWNFPYYWYGSSRFKVGSNGYITFDNTTTAFAPAFAQLPATSLPNDLMAICVGDLVFSGQAGAAGDCFYWSNGTDSLVVSFINVTEWESAINPNTKHTFQVILAKGDSSITYQYGVQQGRYNSTNNTRLCIGMENATGQIGLNYTYSTAPPHALLPDSGLAIKFKRTRNTGLQVTDGGIVGGLNSSNTGKMIRVGVADTVKCVIKNFGTAPITNATVRYAITLTGQPASYDTIVVPSLAVSQEMTITFPRLFTPAVAGSYSALFTIVATSDANPTNNTKTAEIRSVNFGTTGSSTLLAFENGTLSGNTSWIGGGGFGVAFDLPTTVYPVYVETVYVRIASITAQPMIVQILDGSTGVPGTVLAQRTNVTAVVGQNAIVFNSDSVRINGGRFFVGATGQLNFYYETTAPVSYRTWEYTGGWAPYRSGDLQDIHIRATVRRPGAVTPGHDIGVSSIARTSANDAPAVRNQTIDAPDISDVVDLSSGENITYAAMADTARFRAIVQNYGTFPETTYQVRFTVNGNTISTLSNGRILAVGGRDTFNLAWNTGTPGAHVAKAFTILASDANRTNDTASANFTIAGASLPGDTLYSFIVRGQIILGVAKLPSNKLVFTSGGQSSGVTTDNKWIVTTLAGTVIDTTHAQLNPTSTGGSPGFGFRDLAWDGRWLLTSDDTRLRRVDTATFTELRPAITGPGTLQRGVAAETNNRIWKSNFTSDPVVKFDTTGATVRTLGVPTVAPYGIAFDKWTSRNRGYLWYAQPSTTGGPSRLSKVDTATGAILTTYDYGTTFGISGGLDIVNNHPAYPGKVVAFLGTQNFPNSRCLVIYLGPDSSSISPPGWTVQTSGTTQALRCVKALDQSNGWIGGASGTVLRTTNGGTTWSSVGGGPMGTNTVYAIEALSATTAFTTTSPTGWSHIFRTTNGGTSWDTVYSQANGFIDAIKMYDASNGIAVGDPVDSKWTILKTTNGGSTWARIATEPAQAGTEAGYNTSMSTFGTTHVWFGTDNSRVYYTTNGGTTWNFTATAFSASVGVGFLDANYGVAGGSSSNNAAARSTNGGATWVPVTMPGSGSIYGIVGKGSDFWAGRNTLVLHSGNRGLTWDTSYAGAIGAFRHLDFVWQGNNAYGWGATATGGIAYFNGVLTGIDDRQGNPVAKEFALMQNYPNPFNPTTTISYSLPEAARVNLSIYNVLGQRVAELTNETQRAGFYNVTWDGRNETGSQVATGVYFYRLEATPNGGAQFVTLKKALLLK